MIDPKVYVDAYLSIGRGRWNLEETAINDEAELYVNRGYSLGEALPGIHTKLYSYYFHKPNFGPVDCSVAREDRLTALLLMAEIAKDIKKLG